MNQSSLPSATIVQKIADTTASRFWSLRLPQTSAKLLALLRFPIDKRKRKNFRYQLIETLELGALIDPKQPAGRAHGTVSANGLMATGALRSRPPTVSAIVPNYNHAKFLKQRISSIVKQCRPISELIILDDASTDDSLEVIKSLTRDLQVPCTVLPNKTNSGSIFKQWEKGLAAAKGDLIWICESDDDCDEHFLETLVPYFFDPSVMLAFGNIDFIDQNGDPCIDMNRYMDYSGFFKEPRVASSNSWFNGPFGLRCVIKNVGGCVFRRRNLRAQTISELVSYRTCGDWFLYSQLARGGKIAFDPQARASFRVHGQNSSVSSFKTKAYYDECLRVLQALRRSYDINPRTVQTALQNIFHQCDANLGPEIARSILPHSTYRKMLAIKRTTEHIAFRVADRPTKAAIETINAKVEHGDDVSLLIDKLEPGQDWISELPRGISLVPKKEVESVGEAAFGRAFGVTQFLTL